MDVHYSSKTPEWSTPQELYDKLNTTFNFTLDPCATNENAKCKKYFTMLEDGLSQTWVGERVFMNPPYGRGIERWVQKAYETAQSGGLVVCLLPARVDTKWWHNFCSKGDVTFIKGRLRFGGSSNNAPFPSAIVIFRGLEQ